MSNKNNIEIKQHEVVVVLTDGSKFPVLTTHGKKGDKINLEFCPNNHPAWKEKDDGRLSSNSRPANSFRKKYGSFIDD